MSSIGSAPSPALSGTALALSQDTGDRFPIPPFTALVYTAQTVPVEGVDSETVTCNIIDHDVACITRGPSPITIVSGMMFAALKTETVYSIEEHVTLLAEFPIGDTGFVLRIKDPQGNISEPALDGLGAPSSGGSTFTYVQEATKPGQWYYEFFSNERVKPEADFFIRFSDVLP
jgi:hypothetical protein